MGIIDKQETNGTRSIVHENPNGHQSWQTAKQKERIITTRKKKKEKRNSSVNQKTDHVMTKKKKKALGSLANRYSKQ